MKQTAVWLLMIVAMSCGLSKEKDRIRNFIPGVYVFEGSSTYSRAYDTLRIWKESGEAYHILKKTRYHKIVKKRLQPPGIKQDVWTAAYDEAKQILVEKRQGRVITLNPDKKMLLVGSKAYRKVDDE